MVGGCKSARDMLSKPAASCPHPDDKLPSLRGEGEAALPSLKAEAETELPSSRAEAEAEADSDGSETEPASHAERRPASETLPGASSAQARPSPAANRDVCTAAPTELMELL